MLCCMRDPQTSNVCMRCAEILFTLVCRWGDLRFCQRSSGVHQMASGCLLCLVFAYKYRDSFRERRFGCSYTAWPVERIIIKIWSVEGIAHSDSKKRCQVARLLQTTSVWDRNRKKMVYFQCDARRGCCCSDSVLCA